MKKTNENEIIWQILDGQTERYEILVRRHERAVYNVLYQMLQQPAEAEELAQEVFVKAYEKLNTFNFKNQFFSWIYRIAINTAISHRHKSRRYLHPEVMPESTEQENTQDQQIEKSERDAALRRAIQKLKENYRAVLVLYYFEQLSYAGIAEVLEVPKKKVKSRLFDARRMLRSTLEKEDFFRE